MDVGKLRIQISKTTDGGSYFVQISSPAVMPVNIVLIAAEIEIDDQRPQKKATRWPPP